MPLQKAGLAAWKEGRYTARRGLRAVPMLLLNLQAVSFSGIGWYIDLCETSDCALLRLQALAGLFFVEGSSALSCVGCWVLL